MQIISERVTAQIDEAVVEDGVMPWAPAEEVVTPPVPGEDPAADPE
jgi:hypothetical protein